MSTTKDSQFAILQHALAVAEHSTRASSIEKILAEELRRLEAENAELRKALEPFAEHGQRILDGKRGPLALTSDETMYAVSFGELRRASAALAKPAAKEVQP